MTKQQEPRYVDHTYHDLSRFVEQGGELITHKKSTNNFPARLHRLLSNPDHSDVITWMPHGRAWKVIDKERLIDEVIPHYYVCKKFASFTRQLNGWGFKRLHQAGPDFGCYYHEAFLRDMPELTCLIRRLQPKGGKSVPCVEGEPNFYLMSRDYPLPPPQNEEPALALAPEESTTPSRNDRARAASLGSPNVSAAGPQPARPSYASNHRAVPNKTHGARVVAPEVPPVTPHVYAPHAPHGMPVHPPPYHAYHPHYYYGHGSYAAYPPIGQGPGQYPHYPPTYYPAIPAGITREQSPPPLPAAYTQGGSQEY